MIRRTPATILARARLVNAADKANLAGAWPEQNELIRRAADELPNVSTEVKSRLNPLLLDCVVDVARDAGLSLDEAIKTLGAREDIDT